MLRKLGNDCLRHRPDRKEVILAVSGEVSRERYGLVPDHKSLEMGDFAASLFGENAEK